MATEQFSSDAWYACAGVDDDVILSTRSRLARNLANFPFPTKMQPSEGERVQAIVFDAFNHIPQAESYHALSTTHLDSTASRILEERGILESARPDYAGLVYRSDGKISCMVNVIDHVRIASFVPGFDFDQVVVQSREVDGALQGRIQFAASYDFGYLTSRPLSSGSGMRLSVRAHLPALSLSGQIASVSKELSSKRLSFTACFGSGNTGAALGNYYQISSNSSSVGTEFDQIAGIASEVQKLVAQERSLREQIKKSMSTELWNTVLRSLALVKYSRLMPLRESIELLGGIKIGKDFGFLSGVDDSALHALLYRVQEGHLRFIEASGNFTFESDIISSMEKKLERLRAVLLQEALDDVQVVI